MYIKTGNGFANMRVFMRGTVREVHPTRYFFSGSKNGNLKWQFVVAFPV